MMCERMVNGMKYAVSRITLDLQDTSSPITLSAKQGDSIREIICGFRDDNGPYKIDPGCAVVFTAEKPDGNRIFNECTVEGNFVRYRFTAQTVSVLGALKCEFKIYEDMSQPPKLTSPRFMINVEEPVFNDGDIPESSYEFNAISDLVRKTTIEYLEAHPAITDKTLTLKDNAADAAAVGTRIDTLSGSVLHTSGGTMTGPIAMGGNPVTGLGTPTGSGDAASKSYVDGKHFVVKVNLPSSGWAGDAAPYTQTVSVPGILATDTPHFGNVSFSSDDTSGKIKRRDSFAMIDDLDTADGSVTFTCFEQKPPLSVTVQLEVNR